ncbi:hypothetical protein LPB140_08595 [Sphingorhabdus lutea]|uniref:DUF2062 domain-containing protein n=2 Tax=Sphingorhabdus lutea TaxID=1913578 RepID=A0A1L3JF90_9SPHN|nr:hypothetical protein LPB140_08595 [Sphingorhabdus lutea]
MKWIKRKLPSREILLQNPMLRPFAHRLMMSELWRFTRRSVPAGVALGFVTAIIVLVPGFQIFVAVLLCPVFRANIPVAVVATFLNTPLTTPPLIYASYILGLKLLGSDRMVSQNIGDGFAEMSLHDWWQWFLYEAGPPVLIGLFTIAVLCGAIGYLVSSWLWGRWIMSKRRRRSMKIDG